MSVLSAPLDEIKIDGFILLYNSLSVYFINILITIILFIEGVKLNLYSLKVRYFYSILILIPLK